MRETGRNPNATALIFNTFDALEMEVLDVVKSQLPLPPVYTVGPFHLLLNQFPLSESHFLRSNMWKKDTKCLKWLDSIEPNSVVYVNFGSLTVMTTQQFVEELANSKYTFLWIIRDDLVVGELASLPAAFTEQTKERGLLVSWCPQEDVLNHASIAGFLTHCGRNSTLEGLSCGVPLICWPLFGDQQTNCRYSCNHWEVGIQKDQVERLVRELMEGEKGKKMKKIVLDWKKKAEEAASPGGSFYAIIDKIISEILGSKIRDQFTK
ncbi:7-deoxyloganetin glucosyltransferase-like [Papaver somniferum]|uniref:7-deoxyloganetin glucosyltransferase-like n=1 Tax=Papaver somniferum TaxID=3469 RepID=UPI000E6F810B|nr:7-deoxyloganetin glucosyltransferase-like [Papaver somniferum]